MNNPNNYKVECTRIGIDEKGKTINDNMGVEVSKPEDIITIGNVGTHVVNKQGQRFIKGEQGLTQVKDKDGAEAKKAFETRSGDIIMLDPRLLATVANRKSQAVGYDEK